MQIFRDEPIKLGWLSHSFSPPAVSGVFLAKLTCRLQHGGVSTLLNGDDAMPLMGDVFSGAVCDASLKTTTDFAPLKTTTDFAPLKPKFDFLLTATAYPPSQTPQPTWTVGCRIGEWWSKALRVVGPRHWIREYDTYRFSNPTPIANLPLDYRLAFGGLTSKRNPVGRGFGAHAEWLPNTEFLDCPVQRPDDDIPPAGFAPISSSWLPRIDYLGTYDNHWQQTRWPWYPKDFNYNFFNAAPLDQQFDHPLIGNELLEFENLHPEHHVYRTRLPGVRVRCFISRFHARIRMPSDQFTEVPLAFDTLQVDLNRGIATLMWRGNTPVESLKMREVKTVLMLLEAVEQTKPPVDVCMVSFRRMYCQQFGMSEAEVESLEVMPLSGLHTDLERQLEALKAELAILTQLGERQELRAREQAIAAGMEPAVFGKPSRETSLAQGIVSAKASLAQTADSLREEQPESARQLDESVAMLEEAEAMLPRELSREQVEPMIAARESFANCSLIGLELDGLDFSGLNCTKANFSTARLRGANFTRANLSTANLREADLSLATMHAACLDHADFSGAVLQGCQFVNASLHGTNFADQQLTGNDFSSADGHGADFSQTNLLRCRFNDAKLPYSNFTAAEIVDTSFERAKLKAAQFENVRAQKVCMRGADLSGIHASDGSDFTEASFEQVQAAGSIWQDSILDRANFSDSELSQALFTGASLIQAKFDRSDLNRAVLDDANLQQSSLDQCNLLYASLDRANLRDARMREANIYNAGFWNAQLEGLDRRGTSVAGTVLPS